MREPFSLQGSGLYFRDRCVGIRGMLTLEPGDPMSPRTVEYYNQILAPEPGGDALWVGRNAVFGWERKTHSDFWNSRNSGHLADQLARMVKWYDSVILGIEGGPIEPDEVDDAGIAWHTYQKVLLDYQDLGVRIVYVDGGPTETLAMMDKLRRAYSTRDATEPLRQPTSARGDYPVLLAIPGIGPRTAHRLVDCYGTVSAVFDDSWGGLVEEFGVSIAGKIWRALEREIPND